MCPDSPIWTVSAYRIVLRFVVNPNLSRDAALSRESKTEVHIAKILLGTLIALLMIAAVACLGAPDEEDLKSDVVEALDAFAEELVADRPVGTDDYTARLQAYLEAHPVFFGSAAAVLDSSGEVVASPYVYRTGDGYGFADLAEPSYNIEAQDWFAEPIATDAAVWTEPYFDAGGGDIWMITRSVLLRDAQGVFAVVTTDLPVDDPNQ